jgi:hypothetical protein
LLGRITIARTPGRTLRGAVDHSKVHERAFLDNELAIRRRPNRPEKETVCSLVAGGVVRVLAYRCNRALLRKLDG